MLNTKDEIPYTSGVYKIENKTNHKVYVGSTVNLYHRMYEHSYTLENNIHKNKHLQASWNKYGKDAFEFSVIEECDKDNLLIREQYWLDYYKAYDNQYGYNICRFAGNTLGKKLSEETKQKIREASTGRKASDEAKRKMSESRTGKNNGMHGKHHTEESKQKMREHAPDYSGEKNPFYGRKHSDETKQKISEKNKGRIISEEERKMRSVINSGENNPFYGKHHSDEIKEKIKKTNIERGNYQKASERMKKNNPNDGSYFRKPIMMLGENFIEIIDNFNSCRQAAKWIIITKNLKSKLNSVTGVISRAVREKRKAYGYRWLYGKNKYDRNYTQKTMCNIHIIKKNHNDIDKIYDEMINRN